MVNTRTRTKAVGIYESERILTLRSCPFKSHKTGSYPGIGVSFIWSTQTLRPHYNIRTISLYEFCETMWDDMRWRPDFDADAYIAYIMKKDLPKILPQNHTVTHRINRHVLITLIFQDINKIYELHSILCETQFVLVILLFKQFIYTCTPLKWIGTPLRKQQYFNFNNVIEKKPTLYCEKQ